MYRIIKNIAEKKERIVAGIMSGTSLDGIDVSISKISGYGKDTEVQMLYFETFPYTRAEKEALLKVCGDKTSSVSQVCKINKDLGVKFGNSVVNAADKAGIRISDIDFVSSHGQTIFHIPSAGATLQIGELADIAAITGLPAAGDFRPSDMAYGGEGAPLVPYFDFIMFGSETKNTALINLGGISNITCLHKNCTIDDIIAFDMGPGNVIIDNLMKINSNGKVSFDLNGDTAAKGTVSIRLLGKIIANDSFLHRKPPKSTGREDYTFEHSKAILEEGISTGLKFEDIIATVTEYTAYAVYHSLRNFIPFGLDEYYVSGGGSHNKTMIKLIERYLNKKLISIEEKGVSADAKESVAFAVLGNEFIGGNYNNAKKATGAGRDVIMGKLTLPSPMPTDPSEI